MGWSFSEGVSHNELIARRVRPSQSKRPDGVVAKSVCIAHKYIGGRRSGVLWSVWERTFEQNGEAAERWIKCDLFEFVEGAWGYKDLDETMYPFDFSCPLEYLDMVPLEVHGGHPEWRQQVRQFQGQQVGMFVG